MRIYSQIQKKKRNYIANYIANYPLTLVRGSVPLHYSVHSCCSHKLWHSGQEYILDDLLHCSSHSSQLCLLKAVHWQPEAVCGNLKEGCQHMTLDTLAHVTLKRDSSKDGWGLSCDPRKKVQHWSGGFPAGSDIFALKKACASLVTPFRECVWNTTLAYI